MNIYLLRHAIATERPPDGTDSPMRALTAEGREKLDRIIALLCSLGATFDVILFSPYLRTRQTAEAVAAGLGLESRLRACPELAPDAVPNSVLEVLRRIQPAPESVLLVGHEPDLSFLISMLLTGGDGLAIRLKKSALCKLTTDSVPAPRSAQLDWMVTPKLFKRPVTAGATPAPSPNP